MRQSNPQRIESGRFPVGKEGGGQWPPRVDELGTGADVKAALERGPPLEQKFGPFGTRLFRKLDGRRNEARGRSLLFKQLGPDWTEFARELFEPHFWRNEEIRRKRRSEQDREPGSQPSSERNARRPAASLVDKNRLVAHACPARLEMIPGIPAP